MPALLGLCAGYEREEWRCDALAEYLMEWLPDFALSDEELNALGRFSVRRVLREAAVNLYRSTAYEYRGEFGELVLHVVLRQHFGTVPAIRKIYFKDAPNDTLKGFDAVHVVANGDELELLLGEVKFYGDIRVAIRDVTEELRAHSKSNYLRDEFIAIKHKIPSSFAHRDRVQALLDNATSLDEIFRRVRFPVLLTYDSGTTARHRVLSDLYRSEITAELREAHAEFASRGLPRELTVHLVLVPLATKAALVRSLDAKLKGQQA